ncbi:Tenascin-R [Orchesella cincta]|uniref:Tenascin-R n=1 Tax=Orchesella cincta TaxID=48709 RepID=A0A1D2NDL8_ORCCI|nr:Tenascin-R [Orchesella cincta]
MSRRPRTCEHIQLHGYTTSGVYRIYPFGSEHNGTEVYCDLESERGGWTVIQRRDEHLFKRVDFERTWQDYALGFGIPHESYWLGLDVISELTKSGDFELQIELTDWEEEKREAKYAYFRIANSAEKYRIHIADYSGDAGDSLAYHNGMAFTTTDFDNDLEKNVNCAQKYHGAWWYKSCHQEIFNI